MSRPPVAPRRRTAPVATPAAAPAPLSAAAAALRQLRPSDLRGVARLASQATLEVSRVVEGVHQSVRGHLGLPAGAAADQTAGLTGLIYQSVRGVTRVVDLATQAALRRLEPWLDRLTGPAPAGELTEREAVLAALNGVMGDRLAADGNPLATAMGLYQDGRPLDLVALGRSGAASGRVLLLVHGLCMNDQGWQHQGHDHGAHLARAQGWTPVYLRYNTGLHTSANGRALAGLLDGLLAQWPVPVQDLAIVAHSMGGLVSRSACAHAAQAGQPWLARLQHLVCLGTPHHGAPLERAGHWAELLLGRTPYTRPFGRLAQLRSAGITDLRYGHVQDSDWQGRDRFRRSPDTRQPLPLPAGVACATVAATLAGPRRPLAERLLGDGLVPLPSALGQHPDPAHCLAFARTRQRVLHGVGHLALLSDARVAEQLVAWLGEDPAAVAAP